MNWALPIRNNTSSQRQETLRVPNGADTPLCSQLKHKVFATQFVLDGPKQVVLCPA